MPQMGLDALAEVGCAAVKRQNAFAPTNEFALGAIRGKKVSIAFFCSAVVTSTKRP
jgi:hypothetical protein